ncbi:hypothetical protein MASR2M18_02720 [Ignavibacteria bacterium]|nr:hypothetical protein [Bacteroidota bacterium]MCZ2133584.1 hypothetical protein [Bacteroidota bacterium]
MNESDAKLKLLLEMRAQFRRDNPSLNLRDDAAALARIKQLEDEAVEREAAKLRIEEIEKTAKERPAAMKYLLTKKYNIGTK